MDPNEKKDKVKTEDKPHFVLEIQDSTMGQSVETPTSPKEAENG